MFPVPTLCPRAFARDSEPLDNGCAEERDFCFATATFCNVCFLQYGQYLFVFSGNFILFFQFYWD